MMTRGKRMTLFAALIAALALIGGISYFGTSSAEHGKIVDFDEARDMQECLKIFYDDWYWLFPGPDYSPEFILKYRSPGEPAYYARYQGKLIVKVLRDNNKVAGFTTYYQKNFYEGEIQFIAVAKEFRRKGYGKQLTEFAVKSLFDMGVQKVSILTRLGNEKARRIYERLGFQEESRDEEFIYYSVGRTDFKG